MYTTKASLYDRMLELGVAQNVVIALCNFYNFNELLELVEFFETEL
jgi:hypothetical protein